MAPQLKDALSQAAAASGSSLNAYVVQVLAAAAGHHARFRGTTESGPTTEEKAQELREIPRDAAGNPLDRRLRFLHSAARSEFFEVTAAEVGDAEAGLLTRKYDVEDPAFFLEWKDLRDSQRREDRGPGSLPAAG
jgi:hypothetical protein